MVRLKLPGLALVCLLAWAAALQLAEFARAGDGGGPLPVVPLRNPQPGPDVFWRLLWPYGTSAGQDLEVWRQIGVNGFEVDHGPSRWENVALARRQGFPYYAGHAAGKGILHLTRQDQRAVMGRGGVLRRPRSLFDPAVLQELKRRITANMAATASGPVIAHALEDEVSLASFTSPADVDGHPLAVAAFREWLRAEYKDVSALNAQWGTDYRSFGQIRPMGFGQLRTGRLSEPLSAWNLSPWMDFRRFMDEHFARVLRQLVDHARAQDPDAPVGIVGAQAPGPWGGYDYGLLAQSVQWVEAYDNLATAEIVRSLFHQRGRPSMVTLFPSGNAGRDSFFLWRHLCHGVRGAIVWPENVLENGALNPEFGYLPRVLAGLDGPAARALASRNAQVDPDPIGVYLSQPSLMAGWAMDAMVHGASWPKRLASVDNQNQSMGLLRWAWCLALEDLGFQYTLLTDRELSLLGAAALQRFRVLILPQVMCLSRAEAEAMETFVRRGGVLVADALPGVFDEHGKARARGVLDKLFGVRRNLDAGLLAGRGCLGAVDAERHAEPLLRRLECLDKSPRHGVLAMAERELASANGAAGKTVDGAEAVICRRVGQGQVWYLNLAPHDYVAAARRYSKAGQAWRETVRGCLQGAGLAPRARARVTGARPGPLETLHWRKGDDRLLAVLGNPGLGADEAGGTGLLGWPGATDDVVEISLTFPNKVCLDAVAGRSLGCGKMFRDSFAPWKASVYYVRQQ